MLSNRSAAFKLYGVPKYAGEECNKTLRKAFYKFCDDKEFHKLIDEAQKKNQTVLTKIISGEIMKEGFDKDPLSWEGEDLQV